MRITDARTVGSPWKKLDRAHPRRCSTASANLERLEERTDALTVQAEKSQHDFDLRIQKLTEFQVVLMESQNDTWRALTRLSENVDKLIRGLQSGNGDREDS